MRRALVCGPAGGGPRRPESHRRRPHSAASGQTLIREQIDGYSIAGRTAAGETVRKRPWCFFFSHLTCSQCSQTLPEQRQKQTQSHEFSFQPASRAKSSRMPHPGARQRSRTHFRPRTKRTGESEKRKTNPNRPKGGDSCVSARALGLRAAKRGGKRPKSSFRGAFCTRRPLSYNIRATQHRKSGSFNPTSTYPIFLFNNHLSPCCPSHPFFYEADVVSFPECGARFAFRALLFLYSSRRSARYPASPCVRTRLLYLTFTHVPVTHARSSLIPRYSRNSASLPSRFSRTTTKDGDPLSMINSGAEGISRASAIPFDGGTKHPTLPRRFPLETKIVHENIKKKQGWACQAA